MSTTLTISDELAAALEDKRKQSGMPTIDEAAEVLLTDAIAHGVGDAEDFGLPEEDLRSLIVKGEASGPSAAWDSQTARDEVRRLYAKNKAR